MNQPSASKTLHRRPEARGFRVEQILEEAANGRLRIPPFQRPLRWKSKQVIEFFDSIRRGFPVGDLLLSRDRANREALRFGPCAVDAPEQHAALWVIDGQQRITALVACLMRNDPTPKGDYWAIWYDLENEVFVRLHQMIVPSGWIPLNVLCNSVSLLKWIRTWPYGDQNPDLVDRALELGKAVREYEVPAYIVDGADESLLRLIFTRVNTAGSKMRESEIFEARYGKEGDKPIRTAVARLTDLGFGELDEDLFLRCLRSTCGISAIESIESPEDIAGDSILRTEKAFRRAVFALQSAAGIPHWKLLPYRLPIIFLTTFFDRFPNHDSRVDRLAAKWAWQGALSGEHQEVTDAKINRLLKETQNFVRADEALSSLLKTMGPKSLEELANNPAAEFDKLISMNRASGKIFILGLLAANPVTEEQTSQLELELDIESDDQEFSTEHTLTTASSVLNLKKILLSIINGSKYGTDVIIGISGSNRETLFSADDAGLASHLLDRDAIQLLRNGDIDKFRSHRKLILRDYFLRFVNDRIGDTVDVRPSIKSIVASSSKLLPVIEVTP